MGKLTRNLVVIDKLLSINASSIAQKAKEDQSMILRWYSGRDQVAGMRCEVKEQDGQLIAFFMYYSNAGPEHITIEITTTASNLGIGRIPFFVCPISGQRCRKLYLINGKLLSSAAIKGALYDCQTLSKKYRALMLAFDRPFQLDKLNKRVESPYFKPIYRGHPTSTLKHIAQKIATLQQCSSSDILKEILVDRNK